MMVRLFAVIAALVVTVLAPARAAADDSARAILERAVEAAGGEAWLHPSAFYLAGHAVFYAPDSATSRRTADDYRMWRAMSPDRTTAHGANGKVRNTAKSRDKLLFKLGYDGTTTWTENGVMPQVQADAYWASNFEFCIIREALGNGFTPERAPDREVAGHPIALIRVIWSGGATTLWGGRPAEPLHPLYEICHPARI